MVKAFFNQPPNRGYIYNFKLDPTYENIPQKNLYYCEGRKPDAPESLFVYCGDYIHAVKELAPAIKINSAFFEAVNAEDVYRDVAQLAKDEGLFVIGDVKRADIGSTSKAYAKAFLGADSPFDAITINPYFGTDGIKPFIEMAAENGKVVLFSN